MNDYIPQCRAGRPAGRVITATQSKYLQRLYALVSDASDAACQTLVEARGEFNGLVLQRFEALDARVVNIMGRIEAILV